MLSGHEDFDELVEIVRTSKNPSELWGAFKGICQHEDKTEAASAVALSLRHPDKEVRLNALSTLDEIGNVTISRAIKAMLTSEKDAEVREAAETILAGWGK